MSLVGPTEACRSSLLGFPDRAVVNNGILCVDTVNQYRSTMDLRTALIEARCDPAYPTDSDDKYDNHPIDESRWHWQSEQFHDA